ncbi:Cyclic nucleotide-gated potassium channel [Planctomycetes bacterium MalM25]|nr:Cyclic nucleotide-gated potassium channel [Planctomycetes bacterium MalM25]
MSITKLRSIIESTDTPAGRAFDATVQLLIVISMVAFAIETLPNLSATTRCLLRVIELGSLVLFTAEYLLRLLLAEKPLRYATSFFGVVDLLAIAPMMLGAFDARTVRALRLLRLLRLLKLVRYSAAVRRLHLALKIAWEELILFSVISGILLFIAAAGIYQFEHEAQPEAFASIFHALWWAMVTLTTVGYGDVYPITVGGRAFTFLVLVVGLGVVAAPTAMVASALTQARQIESAREEDRE